MITTLGEASALRHGSWPRLARVQLSDVLHNDEAPRRAVIVGTAGSGKSTLLRAVERELGQRKIDVTTVRPGSAAPSPSDRGVLLVDDAHLLDATLLESVIAHAGRSGASVFATIRPDSHGRTLREFTALLEHDGPAITLGHITRDDIGDSDARGASPGCLDDICTISGNVTWLVFAALAAHRPELCADGCAHDTVRSELHEAIAHRLSTLDEPLRAEIERRCLSGIGQNSETSRALIAAGHGVGLLLRNGRPVPLVRSAVLETIPQERIFPHWAALAEAPESEAVLAAALAGIHNDQLAEQLMQQGTQALAQDPARAAALFRRAADAGGSGVEVALCQARAAVGLGQLDAASAQLESASAVACDALTDAVASIWSARGMADQAAATYRALPVTEPRSVLHAAVAAVAVGDRGPLDATAGPSDSMPSPTTLSVALERLVIGLHASLDGPPAAAVRHLVSASDLYSASGSSLPLPELPAVIAAIAAINAGELDVAASTLESALHTPQGGVGATDRLRLWTAWVALQREHPHDAESALSAAISSARPLDPRDSLLAGAIQLAMARRYSDEAGLEAAWQQTSGLLLTAQFDLFSLHPLTEFVVSAARVHASDQVDSHFFHALELTVHLGAPVSWTAHLYWAAIQRAIIRNRPHDLKPHARALVAASRRSKVASAMAQAGSAWTSVLSGEVDPDAVEDAARRLATVGLSWDGARLAGHGASRTDDRKTISRLLATARHLHPREESSSEPDHVDASNPQTRRANVSGLSAREIEVAELVLQGKTYAEIGEAIFISPRTAEHHIARIRRRLGATNRSDLLGKLRLALGPAPIEPADGRSSAFRHAATNGLADPLPDPLAGAGQLGDNHRRGR